MDKKTWKNQTWILEQRYPAGVKRSASFLLVCSVLLLVLIFCYHYPIYETYYGMVTEDNNDVVSVIIPFSKLEEFSNAIVKNESMKLIKVDSKPQFQSGEKVINALVKVSISKKLLVENNIVTLRVKIKNMSIWKEFSKKWKGEIKNETS